MSKASIDKILNRAANVAGRVLGTNCEVFRPVTYMNPVSDENFIHFKRAAFLLDEKFSKTVDYKFQLFNVEVDTTNVQPGDIFDEGDDFYVILSARPREGCKAYLANSMVTVIRPTYVATNGNFGPTPVVVASHLPVNIYSVKGSNVLNQNAGKQTPGKQIDYEMRLYTNEPILKVGDQLSDSDSNKSVITSVEFGPLGYTVVSQSV